MLHDFATSDAFSPASPSHGRNPVSVAICHPNNLKLYKEKSPWAKLAESLLPENFHYICYLCGPSGPGSPLM